jgi:hypothetical protein
MVGELEQVGGRVARWRFVLTCVTATLLFPARRGDPGRIIVALVAAAAMSCAGLVAYALLRYPAIRAAAGTWPSVAAFIVVLAVYAFLTVLVVRRGAGAPVPSATRSGLAGGLFLAAAWTLVALAVAFQASWFAFSWLLIGVPLASAAVGAAGTWRGRAAAAGRQAALLSAVIAGLMLFLALAAVTFITARGPYDAGQLQDFPTSGYPDLASYAVSDNLGTGMALLLVVPIATAVFGSAGAMAAGWVRRAPA